MNLVNVPAKALLFASLSALGAVFIAIWWAAVRRSPPRPGEVVPGPGAIAIGVLTDFFDALGVGSFATTTSLYKLGGVVRDDEIPGTLNVGHTLPTFAQAFIFIAVINVDMNTLSLMITASVVGAWFGAGVVAAWPRRRIQFGMGVLLIVAAGVIAARQLGLVPGGGNALGLSGARLAIGMAGNMVLGALMTLGIGLYAPCMILVSLLGMNQGTAFPIMMGSCAFLMPAAGVRFIRSGRYDLRAALGLTAGGVPGSLVAGLIVKNLPLAWVKWLVVVVVVYTAVAMLRSASQEKRNV